MIVTENNEHTRKLILETIGIPCIVKPAYSLKGVSFIAKTEEELFTSLMLGMESSLVAEVKVEKYEDKNKNR